MLNVRFTNSFIEERICQFFIDLILEKLTAQVAIASALSQGMTKIHVSFSYQSVPKFSFWS